ncbi:hypothetical protein [Pedobacter nyackensis]|uniref:Uncharacterized protein n=1 Tax=Pedobacter nyackensis TaxID=475255 RepID=A0A1W2ABW6_9SPHI|nr:hypothetical protein [Pedobacter nyackensis]SMC58156.1 hypothetical protein SAMN04488101_101461 [Pedobacter nyackensis]
MDYTLVAIVVVLVISLIAYLILRNKKDEKRYVDESNKADLKPDKHDKPKA